MEPEITIVAERMRDKLFRGDRRYQRASSISSFRETPRTMRGKPTNVVSRSGFMPSFRTTFSGRTSESGSDTIFARNSRSPAAISRCESVRLEKNSHGRKRYSPFQGNGIVPPFPSTERSIVTVRSPAVIDPALTATGRCAPSRISIDSFR